MKKHSIKKWIIVLSLIGLGIIYLICCLVWRLASWESVPVAQMEAIASQYLRENYGIETESARFEYVTIGEHESYGVVNIWDGGNIYAVYFDPDYSLIPRGDNVSAVEMDENSAEIMEKCRGLLEEFAPSIQGASVWEFDVWTRCGYPYPPRFRTVLYVSMREVPDTGQQQDLFAFLHSLDEIGIDTLTLSVYKTDIDSAAQSGDSAPTLIGNACIQTDISEEEFTKRMKDLAG